MPRFSLISIFFWITGFAIYFALVAIATREDSEFGSWLINTYGALYGTLLYASGIAALKVACSTSWRARTSSDIAIAMPFSFLPALIGLVSLVHGYISVYQVLSFSNASLTPKEMAQVHATVLVSLLTGLAFSLISFGLLSIAMLVKCRTDPDSSNQDDGG